MAQKVIRTPIDCPKDWGRCLSNQFVYASLELKYAVIILVPCINFMESNRLAFVSTVSLV